VDNTISKTENETEENRLKALRSLYTSVVHYLKEQESSLNNCSSHDEMMHQLKDIMGHENFDRLVALQGRK
jgi:hypothetical protein